MKSPTPKTRLTFLLTFLLAGLLAACGSTSSSSMPAEATSSATVRGPVASLDGGLAVNGVTFRTAGAKLSLPDDSITRVLESEADVKGHLSPGMIVTVRGRLSDDRRTGEADEIEFHDVIEATIDDRGAHHVVVLGESVSIDDSTEIVDRHGGRLTADDLSPGERVEISGMADARGGLRATFVRSRDDVSPEAELEAKGYVVAVNGSILDLAFSRGGPAAMRVDVSGAPGLPAFAVGDLIEVRTLGGPDANGVLRATAAHREDELGARPNDEVEIEGIVVSVAAARFTVAGQVVAIGPSTVFEGGTADDLVPGVKVEAEGVLGEDGVLAARKVQIRASARVDGNIASIDASAATISILGLTVQVSPSAELRDVGSLADLRAGQRVEIRGHPTRDGLGLAATEIRLLSPSPTDRAFLRGVVTAADAGALSLSILGIAVDASRASFSGFGGATSFFAAIAPGQTVVKVRWRPYPASTSEPIEEAEIEN